MRGLRDALRQRIDGRNVRWFAQWGAVIAAILAFVVYVAVTQASQVLELSRGDSSLFASEYAHRMISCLGIFLIIAFLAFFFGTLGYQAVVYKLQSLDDKASRKDATRQDMENAAHQAIHEMHDDGAFGTFSSIEYMLDDVLYENRRYESQMERQQGLIAENFLVRLLKNWPMDVPMAYQTAKSLGIDLHAKNLQVIVFGVSDEQSAQSLDDLEIQRNYQMLKNLLDSMFVTDFSAHSVDIDGFVACLVTAPADGDLSDLDTNAEILRIAHFASLMASKSTGVAIFACMGSVRTGIEGARQSFSEAVELFKYVRIIGDYVPVSVYHEEFSDEGARGEDYHWFRRQMQFMNCIRAEDYRSASAIFTEMVDSDYIRQVQPLKLASYRMVGLISSMVDALDEVSNASHDDYFREADPGAGIISCTSLPELRAKALEVFNSLYDYSCEKQTSPTEERVKQVAAYLEQNYADSNLSLTSVAHEFDVNPSYLSRCFKQVTGVGLFSYLQQIRVNKALELVNDRGLTVAQIAQQVGFNNVLTLNRTLRKYEGTTAGKLRGTE